MDASTLARFETKLDKTNEDGCWIWTAAKNQYGYGVFRMNRKNYLAHRIAYLHWKGLIDEGLEARHICRNKCSNPDHIALGTHAENMKDKVRDGTVNRGIEHNLAKLTEAQVLEIRQRDTENQYRLAEEFGVDQGLINKILRRKVWTHI